MARAIPSDLLDGVLHQGTTILYGASGVGKGRLIAEIIAAGLQGQPFAARNWTRPIERVAIIASDVDAAREYGGYLDRAGATFEYDDAVRIYATSGIPTVGDWAELTGAVCGWAPSLVVIDNSTELVRGSVNDDMAVRELFANLRPFTSGPTRVPVVLAHHVAKPSLDNGGKRGRSPIGSGVVENLSRNKIHVREGFAAEHASVTLELRPREGAPWLAHFQQRDGGRLEYSHTTTEEDLVTRKATRATDKNEINSKVADYVVAECQGLSKRDAATKVAEAFPNVSQKAKDRVAAIQQRFSNGRDFGGLVDLDPGSRLWTRAAA